MDGGCQASPGTPAAGQSAQAGWRLPRGPPRDCTEPQRVQGGARRRVLGKIVQSRTPLAPVMKRIYYLHYRLYRSQMVMSVNSLIFRWVQ